MKKYLVSFDRVVAYTASCVVYADSEEEAINMAKAWEFDDDGYEEHYSHTVDEKNHNVEELEEDE